MRRRRKGKTLGAEPEPHLSGRTHFCELFEDAADGVGDRLVGMEEHFAVVVAPDKPDGKSPSELPPCGLVTDASFEPGADHVEFRLRHRSLQAEEQSVVEESRMVESVLIADEGV